MTNTGDADFRPIWAHLLAPTCNSNMQSQHVSGTAGNSSDYSLLCCWIFYIAIPFVYGVKDLWESQQNLDQLRTFELLRTYLHMSVSLRCSSYFYLFYLVPSNTCAMGGSLKLWYLSVHFEWPPLPPLASPWDGPLGQVSRCMYTSLHTMHKPNPVRYPPGNFEPNEHVSASSRCHLLSIQ